VPAGSRPENEDDAPFSAEASILHQRTSPWIVTFLMLEGKFSQVLEGLLKGIDAFLPFKNIPEGSDEGENPLEIPYREYKLR
jgi:hypothetical protein